MQQVQEIFQRIEENKRKLKDINEVLKDALAASQAYQEVAEQAKVLNEKKRQIKKDIESGFAQELTKKEDLKIDLASDIELLTDVALSSMMKGESVGISDKYENEYEPVFKVMFKKIT